RLCYLEGKTFDEAARQLGCPLGTIATRLAKARETLRDRLTRRGLALAAAPFAAILAETAAPAAVPAAVAEVTTRFAISVVAGQTRRAAGVSLPVIALCEGVFRAMLMSRIKFALFAVVLAVGFALAGGWVVHRSLANDAAGDAPSPAANQGNKPAAEA